MILSLLQKRRSIRCFEPRPVEQEKVDILVEALLRSPSSKRRNPWEFVVVTDPEILSGLAGAKPKGGDFLNSSPLAIVICADPEKCDVWIEDCSIAAIILQLAAEDLGLGSCWSQIRLRPTEAGGRASDYIRDLLNLPSGFEVEAVVGIGYPGEEKKAHPRSSLEFEKIHLNRFGA
ncbi:MAG: nitroreductase family protein [Syntrophotaleaceae bacterium]